MHAPVSVYMPGTLQLECTCMYAPVTAYHVHCRVGRHRNSTLQGVEPGRAWRLGGASASSSRVVRPRLTRQRVRLTPARLVGSLTPLTPPRGALLSPGATGRGRGRGAAERDAASPRVAAPPAVRARRHYLLNGPG